MDYVVGIDVGTGSVKAVAVDLLGKPIDTCSQYYDFDAPKPGYHVQDPEEICTAFAAALKVLVDRAGRQPLAIGLSSAMHSTIVVDSSGVGLAPMITWADNRSSNIATKLRFSDEGMECYRSTGTPIHAMSPLCKLIWLRENEPALFKSAYKFISIKEYIWHKLFKKFEVDESIASCTGLYNVFQGGWNKQSLMLAGITDEFLSEPVETGYTRYHQGNMLSFLEVGIPITIGASDGCLANLGSMAYKPGAVAMTIGTSGAVRIASDRPLLDESAMTFSYILDKKTYICGGPINNGGIALQWWMKNNAAGGLDELDYEKALAEVSGIPAGSEGLIFLPYLTGERAPIWDSESCGVFFGMRLNHKKAHLLRAVLEGICFAMNDVLSKILSGHLFTTSIYVSGGFSQSPIWLQMLADVTGKRLVLVQSGDASATGAAFIAMKSMGLIENYPELNVADTDIIEPNREKTTEYNQYFYFYKQLYTDLKATMHQFGKISKEMNSGSNI